jgi:hypothetical protein
LNKKNVLKVLKTSFKALEIDFEAKFDRKVDGVGDPQLGHGQT